jgi:hypothetical protein
MALLGELREQLSLFVRGEQSLDALRDWLLAAAEEIAESPEAAVHALAGEAWLLIGEHGAGRCAEAAVATAIHAALRAGTEHPVSEVSQPVFS